MKTEGLINVILPDRTRITLEEPLTALCQASLVRLTIGQKPVATIKHVTGLTQCRRMASQSDVVFASSVLNPADCVLVGHRIEFGSHVRCQVIRTNMEHVPFTPRQQNLTDVFDVIDRVTSLHHEDDRHQIVSALLVFRKTHEVLRGASHTGWPSFSVEACLPSPDCVFLRANLWNDQPQGAHIEEGLEAIRVVLAHAYEWYDTSGMQIDHEILDLAGGKRGVLIIDERRCRAKADLPSFAVIDIHLTDDGIHHAQIGIAEEGGKYYLVVGDGLVHSVALRYYWLYPTGAEMAAEISYGTKA